MVAADQIETLAHDRYVGETVIAQLAAADLLILNKVDLVDQARKQQVIECLKTNAPRAALIEAHHTDVPIEITLGSMPWPKGHSFEGVNESDHSDRFVARVFQCATPISEEKLHEVLKNLPRSVLRLKGFVRLDSNPERVRLVQGVGTRWTISDANSDVEQEGCALVVIGAKELLGDEDLS